MFNFSMIIIVIEAKYKLAPTLFHFGFDQEEFAMWAQKAGFEDVTIEIVSVAKKPYGDYPIFLLTGRKH